MPSNKDFETRMNQIKQRMEERQRRMQSERDRSTVEDEDNVRKDSDLDEDTNDACISITKLEKSHSRQPQGCLEAQDRAYSTQVQLQSSRHKKLLSVMSKKTHDIETARGKEEPSP